MITIKSVGDFEEFLGDIVSIEVEGNIVHFYGASGEITQAKVDNEAQGERLAIEVLQAKGALSGIWVTSQIGAA